MTFTNGTIYCEDYILDNNGNEILAPSAATLEQYGWTKVVSRKQMIHELIRAKYTEDEEFKILRKRDTNSAEFAEYDAYVEECIAKVDAELNK